MRIAILIVLMACIFSNAMAQCDISTSGVATVNVSNTAPQPTLCVGQVANFKFTIINFGTDPSCVLPVNSVRAVFSFPNSAVKPYIYNGPNSFTSAFFTWTYNATNRTLEGMNTTAIPEYVADDILVPVIGNEAGTATSPLNLTQLMGLSDNAFNNTGSAQLVVVTSPVVSDQPGQILCNTSTFTMTQSAPVTGSGVWTIVSGTANISTPASPTTQVTGVAAGASVKLKWTVTAGSCSSFDFVTVTNGTTPPVSVSSVVNNTCHAGSTGSIAVTNGQDYSFTIAGPTVNTTGQSTGLFTGLSAGDYTVTAMHNGCSNSVMATVTQPSGTLPDISLGSDYSSNFFTATGEATDIVFNVVEIAGNAATGDTIRVIRIPGYTIGFDAVATNLTIGSTAYTLDNSRWKLNTTDPSFVSIIFDPAHNSTAGTLNCSGRVYVSIKFTRNTSNASTFSMSARLRKANTETSLGNNLNSIVFTAE